MGKNRRSRRSPRLEFLERRVLLSAAAVATVQPPFTPIQRAETPNNAPSGITPAQMQQAYGINSIKFGSVAGTGAGQTIADF
jgi:hypothetical protein